MPAHRNGVFCGGAERMGKSAIGKLIAEMKADAAAASPDHKSGWRKVKVKPKKRGDGPIDIFFDGASRGNGKKTAVAGAGFEARDGGARVDAKSAPLDLGTTNNQAEYHGLILGLRWAIDHGRRRVRMFGDSELVIRQMTGDYRVKNPGLRPLYATAKELASKIDHVTYTHIFRAENSVADALANAGARAAGQPRPSK